MQRRCRIGTTTKFGRVCGLERTGGDDMQARMLRHPLTGLLLGAQLLLGCMSAAVADTPVAVWRDVADPRDGVYLSTPVEMTQGGDGHVYVAYLVNIRI